jgi:hypothetical protein
VGTLKLGWLLLIDSNTFSRWASITPFSKEKILLASDED